MPRPTLFRLSQKDEQSPDEAATTILEQNTILGSHLEHKLMMENNLHDLTRTNFRRMVYM